jgi:hypothetical protein
LSAFGVNEQKSVVCFIPLYIHAIQLGGNINAIDEYLPNAASLYYYEIMANGSVTNCAQFSVCSLIFHGWKPRLKEWMLN